MLHCVVRVELERATTFELNGSTRTSGAWHHSSGSEPQNRVQYKVAEKS